MPDTADARTAYLMAVMAANARTPQCRFRFTRYAEHFRQERASNIHIMLAERQTSDAVSPGVHAFQSRCRLPASTSKQAPPVIGCGHRSRQAGADGSRRRKPCASTMSPLRLLCRRAESRRWLPLDELVLSRTDASRRSAITGLYMNASLSSSNSTAIWFGSSLDQKNTSYHYGNDKVTAASVMVDEVADVVAAGGLGNTARPADAAVAGHMPSRKG